MPIALKKYTRAEAQAFLRALPNATVIEYAQYGEEVVLGVFHDPDNDLDSNAPARALGALPGHFTMTVKPPKNKTLTQLFDYLDTLNP